MALLELATPFAEAEARARFGAIEPAGVEDVEVVETPLELGTGPLEGTGRAAGPDALDELGTEVATE